MTLLAFFNFFIRKAKSYKGFIKTSDFSDKIKYGIYYIYTILYFKVSTKVSTFQ